MNKKFDSEEGDLTGVYQIQCLITNDIYIGSTTESFQKRFYKHESQYKRFMDGVMRATHPILYNAFSKYGYKNFEFSILEVLDNDLELIREIEEDYIINLSPKYNICQEPTRGGSPNLGKKLTQEWKDKIREKSKLYKHSIETLKKITENNKENTPVILIEKDNIKKELTIKEASEYIDCHFTLIHLVLNGKQPLAKGWKITRLSKQAKTITLIKDNNVVEEFKSMNDCDKYINMWRGYTSSQHKKGINKLSGGFEFEISEDIV